MTPSRTRLLLTVWALLTIGLAIRAFARGLVGDPSGTPLSLRPVVIDLDVASVAELATLPGIGRVRAEAIVLDRIRRGPFRGIEELARVDGLGPTTVARLQPFVSCGEPRH